ncbi:alpha/beta hydrolase [uncultured Sulfitobacter sp.]|uniref:alpha/beta fold hydrolase n=1 Tax=uncultured Sulfitobacter sp. TaxID=191468 RepID=UPI00261B82AA|nr:alpha/beta hydrolase [uncultured Sulfitobacter sp.]
MSTIVNIPTPTLVPVNGIQLEVFETGQENRGNPIILCHGWPEHAFSWRHQMPALAAAGYHVIVPNQRGYGNSSCPDDVTDYDIVKLTDDLAALLEHFGYDNAPFIGHDWGANVVWSMAQLHPNRVSKIINLALPYQPRTPKPWIAFMEEVFGADNYFVHFNRQPGVADAALDQNAAKFLGNLYRKNIPQTPPAHGMMLINLAQAQKPLGDPILSEDELAVYVAAFEATGFTGSINWYRNMDRNWELLEDVDPIIHQPALMIYGELDMIPKSESLADFVPNVDVVSLDCGHWVQQEMPDETNNTILEWLAA